MGGGESEWADFHFDPASPSGVVVGRYRWSAEDRSTAFRGTLEGEEGRLRVEWSESTWEVLQYDGKYGNGAASDATAGRCALSLWWEVDISQDIWFSLELTDGVHELTAQAPVDAVTCPGATDDPDYVFATLDGVGAVVLADTWEAPGPDDDADGWPEPLDCDDADAGVNPCAVEDAADEVDEDCDGRWGVDGDGDGVDDATDCDASDPEVSGPRGWFPDADGDGYGEEDSDAVASCEPGPGWANNDADCDDADPARNPGEVDLCDTIDQDCDHIANEGCDDTGAPPAEEPAPTPPEDEGGCGCATPGSPGLAALLAAGVIARRRRPMRPLGAAEEVRDTTGCRALRAEGGAHEQVGVAVGVEIPDVRPAPASASWR